jgi:lipopolysaccharide transport system permease protein
LTPLVDFAIGLVLLMPAMLWFGVRPSMHIVWVPVFLGLAVMTAAAVSIWLAALGVRYRDVRYIVPFASQLWLFASPVAYPLSMLSPRWRLLFAFNPMTGVIEGFRWSLVGGAAPGAVVFLSCAAVVVLFVAGVRYFVRVEGTFADSL